MNTITLCENALEPSTWETVEDVEDVCEFLRERFLAWPGTAKIYHKQVAENSDVTPCDEYGVDRLQNLTGHFYVVVYPEGIETILIIVAVAVAAASLGLSFLLRPHATTPNLANQNDASPNNALSDRQNTQRLGSRIPDIYGKVWSTPDLIQLPYKVFVAGQEQEYCYMCIGEGSYTVDQVREDLTPVSQIVGMSVQVYGPFTSPNSGGPSLQIGAAINEPARYVKSSTSVNGQTLVAPNLTGAAFIGPFLVGDPTTTDIWCNFVAESGSYQIPSATGIQAAVNVTIEVGITPVDASGTPTGIEAFTNVTLNGSATLKGIIGVTLKIHLTAAGMVLVRAKRTTNENVAANVSVSDEVVWRDCFAVSPVTQLNFGNITTVQTLTLPTPTALAITSRKLNLLVTRNIPIGTLAAGVVTFAMPGPTRSAADILCAVAQDPKLGNRQASEIDFVGIYTAINQAAAYFGSTLPTEFCFTFDDTSVSAEETIVDIAAACNCVAFRRGSQLTLSFEQQTVNSTILFNHRNKVPNSETRTVTFGTTNDIDGINLTYTEPNDPLSPNQDIAKILSFPINRAHIHSDGGTSLSKYQFSIGLGTAGHSYGIAVTVTNTGATTIAVNTNAFGTVRILPGQTVNVNIQGVAAALNIILIFQSINIGDSIDFEASNPYIADLANGTNLIPSSQFDFVGAGWIAQSGATVVVTDSPSAAVTPQAITAVGIRNNVQAYILGQRLYNKLIYQNTVTNFQGTEEAAVLVRNDRILVADNTRSDTQDGDVISQNGLSITLSQPANFIAGRTYTIWLQHPDETIESIAITQPDATKPNQVLLGSAPLIALVLDPLMWARTTYWIIDNTPQRASAFLLTDKTPQQGKIHNVTAINYDDRYYANDLDLLKGFVVYNGPEGTGTPAIVAGSTYRPSIFNDISDASTGEAGTTGLTISSAASIFGETDGPPVTVPTANFDGHVIWTGFPPVKLSSATTLTIILASLNKTILANAGIVQLRITGFGITNITANGTFTFVVPPNTFLSTIQVEVIARGNHASTSAATVAVTDINIT